MLTGTCVSVNNLQLLGTETARMELNGRTRDLSIASQPPNHYIRSLSGGKTA